MRRKRYQVFFSFFIVLLLVYLLTRTRAPTTAVAVRLVVHIRYNSAMFSLNTLLADDYLHTQTDTLTQLYKCKRNAKYEYIALAFDNNAFKFSYNTIRTVGILKLVCNQCCPEEIYKWITIINYLKLNKNKEIGSIIQIKILTFIETSCHSSYHLVHKIPCCIKSELFCLHGSQFNRTKSTTETTYSQNINWIIIIVI